MVTPTHSADQADSSDTPDTADTADSVTIAIARDPALVRTVRLVAAAVARRALVEESVIEEIKLAVGEACAVMIGLDPGDASVGRSTEQATQQVDEQVTEQVTVVLRHANDPSVAIEASIEGRVADVSTDLTGLDLTPWALLQRVSDTLEVEEHRGATRVTMSWPAAWEQPQSG